ncbi:MAG: TraB/GumN family protein [bacterium]
MKPRSGRSARGPVMLLVLGAAVIATAAPAAVVTEPLFAWQVRSDTAVVTMMGSVHFGREDFYPLAQVIEEAFEQADALAVEVDALDPAKAAAAASLMMTAGMMPQGRTLEDVLPDSTVARIQEALGPQKAMWSVYKSLKPAFLALILATSGYQEMGLDPQLGLETHFLGKARGAKEIVELESIEQQMALFTGLDDAMGLALLDDTLDQLGDMEGVLEELVEAWQAGDVARVDALMADQVGEDPAMVAFYRRLLDDRNVKMAEAVIALLAGDKDVFVLVGAGHFGGEKGIIRLLEQEGWSISQLRQ